MFRLFQIDPETGAVHVNVGAIERHRYSDTLLAALDAFRSNHLNDLIRTLFRLPESDERAHAVAFTSHLVHELRHAVDLLLTPYGFHRIRIGFEFYEGLPLFLGMDECKIFPFPSWMDDQMRKLLGGEGTERSLSYRLAYMAQNRRLFIEADNRRHRHESGKMMSFGGDAILEALAFGFQVEWLQHPRFDTPQLRKLMPYAFPHRAGEEESEAQLNQFDMTYRWHYALMGAFTEETTPAAASLMYTILFASLCGSFGRDANIQMMEGTGAPTRQIGTRDVSDRAPSRRLEDLLGWFGNRVENGHSIPDEPMDSWELVNDAARRLWQRSIVEEIEADIEADEALLAAWRDSQSAELFPIRPCAAFADLVAVRRALFATLVREPELILRPLRLPEVADDHLSLPICFFYPQGAHKELAGSTRVIERLVPLPAALAAAARSWGEPAGDPDKVVAQQVLYSSWEMKEGKAAPMQLQGTRAWDTIVGDFAPSYKLALYGHRYRTMLELDLVRARDRLRTGQSDVRWDEFYLDVEDFSASSEYFHFYALEVSQCDACGDETNADDSIIASSATVRSSESFLQFIWKDDPVANHLYDLDWSPWLICSRCRAKFFS